MANSKYADSELDSNYVPTEYVVFRHDNRALTPHGGSQGEHVYGHLAQNSLADSGRDAWLRSYRGRATDRTYDGKELRYWERGHSKPKEETYSEQREREAFQQRARALHKSQV